MKKLIIASVLAAAFISPVMADQDKEQQLMSLYIKECRVMGSLVGDVMKKRQEGWSMDEMFEMNDKLSENDKDKTIALLMASAIVGAYSLPAYNDKDLQQRSINSFQGGFTAACLESKRRKAK